MRAIEALYGKGIEQVLRELYYDQGLTQVEVAAVLSVPTATVAGWMVRLGINPMSLARTAAATDTEAQAS